MMTIKLELKTVYGNELFYPMCSNSTTFVSLVNAKTLNAKQIEKIETLGFKVEYYIKHGAHYHQVKRAV